MRKLIVVPCLSLVFLFAPTPLRAEAEVLSVYAHKLKEWSVKPNAGFSYFADYLESPDAVFLRPVKLPVGANVNRLEARAYSPPGNGSVSLFRKKDGTADEGGVEDLARIDFKRMYQWELLVDTTEDGPAPAQVVAGYRYYLRVELHDERVSTIQIFYTAP